MTRDHDAELCRKYPLLYRDCSRGMGETACYFGFACGDGWFSLIDKLSAGLERLIERYQDDHPQVENLPAASSVKEKWGTLRFYMTTSTEEMDKLIQETESRSSWVCEACGLPGTLRSQGWVITRCDPCLKRYKQGERGD